ncbi:MAG: hypothetical protein ACI81R_002401 [Bradymonadia bacterium]|jgi:hypothetical protein
MRILKTSVPATIVTAILVAACQPGDTQPDLRNKAADVTSGDVGGGEEDAGGVADVGAADDVQTFCGDGRADAIGRFTEQCDGADLRGASCQSLDLPEGTLACDANCADYDTTMCIGEAQCGNGIVDDDEACDSGPTPSDACRYGEASCEVCTAECVRAPGVTSTCGDGERDENFEHCETDDLGGFGCQDLGYVSGELACDERCLFERSDCWRPICGDGVLDDGEACDDGDQNVEWYCNAGDETCCRGDCQPGEPEPSAPDVGTDVGNDTDSDIEDGADGDVGSLPDSEDEGSGDEDTGNDENAREPIDKSGCAASAAAPSLAWFLLVGLGLCRRRRE